MITKQANIFHLNILIKIFTLLFYIFYISQSQIAPTWLPNQYFQTYPALIKTNFNTKFNQTNPITIKIPLVKSYSVIPQFAFGIKNYRGCDKLVQQNFAIKLLDLTTTSFTMFTAIKGYTNLRILSLQYMAVDRAFPYHLNTFNNIDVNFSSTGILNPLTNISGTRLGNRQYQNTINYAVLAATISSVYTSFGSNLAKNYIALYLCAIYNSGDSLKFVKYTVTTTILDIASFKIKVTIQDGYQIDLLKFSMVIIDVAHVESGGQFTIMFQSIVLSGTVINYVPIPQQFAQATFIGLLDFSATLANCGLQFNWQLDLPNNRIVVAASIVAAGTTSATCGLLQYRLSIFYVKTWLCPVGYTYFNLDDNLCYIVCPTQYFYQNETTFQCQKCLFACQECNDGPPVGCTNCSQLDNRQFDNITQRCVCIAGFIQDPLKLTSQCFDMCAFISTECVNCISTVGGLKCTECILNYALDSSGTCQYCPIPNCITLQYKNSACYCSECNKTLGFYAITSGICIQCSIPNCLQIKIYNDACFCNMCNATAFYLSDNLGGCVYCSTCNPVCGDGLVAGIEKCDDGNLMNLDGCSSTCTQEIGWKCDGAIQFSCCIIDETLFDVNIVNIQKPYQQNSIIFELSIYPLLTPPANNILDSSNLTLYMSLFYIFSDTILILQKQIIKSNGNIQVTFDYTKTIHSKNGNLTINIKYQKVGFSNCLVSVTKTMDVLAYDQREDPFIYYSQEQFEMKNSKKQQIKAIQIITYVIFFLSIIPCKIVGLELIGVLQIAYFILAQQQEVNLLLEPFKKMSSINGFNMQLYSEQQKKIPYSIQSLEYKALFLNNCNVMLLVIYSQIGLACILYGISNFLKKYSKKSTTISKYLIKQGLLSLMIFNSFNIAFGVGIHFEYADPKNNEYLLSTLAAISSILLLVAVCGLLMFSQPKQFGQFKNKFKPNLPSQLYFIFTLFYRFSLGYYLAVQNHYQLSSLIIIGISFIYQTYNLINLPFKDAYQNYRANICHFNILIILFVSNYYDSMTENVPIDQKAYFFSPSQIQIKSIQITIFISSICLGFEFYKFIKYNIINNINMKKVKHQQNNKQTNNIFPQHNQSIQDLTLPAINNVIFQEGNIDSNYK